MRPIWPTEPPAWPALDAVIDAFEESTDAHGADAVAAFLPDRHSPLFLQAATELVRVDLERRHALGHAARIEDYRSVAPELFADDASLTEIAFEEYRQRRRCGEVIAPGWYARRYGCDTKAWPADPVEQTLRSVRGAAGPAGVSAIRPLVAPPVGEPKPGDDFAGFELLERLGRGAFGVVFLARQRDLAAREVVLKITPRRSVEAQRLARLQHTNITPIYSAHSEGTWQGLCMPYLGRRTLADDLGPAIAREASTLVDRADDTTPAQGPARPAPARAASVATRRRDELDSLRIIAELAEGLAHAHARGIVHSDLKPANILLGDDGVARLLDFNLSPDSTAEAAGTLLVGGTLPYLSPEHLEAVRDGGAVLPASDLYSLGVILFELVAGRRPFPASTGAGAEELTAMADARRRADIGTLARSAGVSPVVTRVLRKLLAADPSDRYSTAVELAEDLRRHAADLPLRHAREPLAAQSVAKWTRRRRRALALVAGLALVASVVGLGLASSRRGARLAAAEARATLDSFRRDATVARLYLHTPGSEPELWAEGADAARRALACLEPSASAWLERIAGEEAAAVRADAERIAAMLAVHRRREAGTEPDSPLGIGGDAGAADPLAHAAGLLAAGDFAAAAAELEAQPEPDSDPARWILLGNAYAGLGRTGDAEACYTAVLALQPGAMAGPYYRGLARLAAGRFSLAEADFTAALAASGERACVLLNRAVARRSRGDLAGAEADLTAALARDDRDPRAWLLRSLVRLGRGDRRGGLADRREGLARSPRDDLGWAARVMAILPESPARALAEALEGLEVFPSSALLLQNAVHIAADRLNDPRQGLVLAERLVAARPEDDSARLTRAVLLARTGDRAGALEGVGVLDPATATPLESLQAACVLALVSSDQPGERDGALDWLRRALAEEPALVSRARTDPDLSSLRGDRRRDELFAAAERLARSLSPAGRKE